MKEATAFHISSTRKTRCDELIESGVFDTLSGLMDFALRLFLLDAQEEDGIPYLRRDPPYSRVSVRVNEWTMGRIEEMGVVSRADLADYALDHLFAVLEPVMAKETTG